MAIGLLFLWITGVPEAPPMPIALLPESMVYFLLYVAEVDRVLEATNSFTTLTVNFATKTARWSDIGSCVYSKAGTRQAHLDSVTKLEWRFLQSSFQL